MAVPRVCVLRAPGTNCDPETAFAFESQGAKADRLHLFRLLEQPALLRDYQILCIPGGFSYGDDLGAGVVFGTQLRTRLSELLREFLEQDRLCLGICNGFQVLMKSGLLPGGTTGWPGTSPPTATLTWNQSGLYIDRWVHLRVGSSKNVFLRGLERLELPIAHAEGRIAVRDPALPQRWQSSGQLALAYCDAQGSTPADGSLLPEPLNPNGSIANIAGLSDPTGRILGLMPHPERYLFATQHPQWTRRSARGAGAGAQLFRNAVEYFCS